MYDTDPGDSQKSSTTKAIGRCGIRILNLFGRQTLNLRDRRLWWECFVLHMLTESLSHCTLPSEVEW